MRVPWKLPSYFCEISSPKLKQLDETESTHIRIITISPLVQKAKVFEVLHSKFWTIVIQVLQVWVGVAVSKGEENKLLIAQLRPALLTQALNNFL
jgi:hypothetical protein